MNAHSKISIALLGTHFLYLNALEALLNSQSQNFEILMSAHLRNDLNALPQTISSSIQVLILALDEPNEQIIESFDEVGDAKIIVISNTVSPEMMNLFVLHGVKGFLGPDTSAEQFFKAIIKVSEGELWLDRFTTSRIVNEISQKSRHPELADPDQLLIARLTEREKGILQAIVDGEGQSLRDIAEKLFISEYTLRNHLTAIYSKLGVKNRLDLYVFAQYNFKKPLR